MTGEELEHINLIEGKIFFFTKSFRRELCGRLYCYFVNMEQLFNDGEDFILYLDDHSEELSQLIKIFESDENEETGCLTKATHKALELDHPFFSYDNFIYVQRLEIVHKHRGKGVGIHFLDQALTYLARAMRFDFFVLKPFPLQSEYENKDIPKSKWKIRLALDKLEKNHKNALKKLISLYAGLGFTKIRGTNFMVCRSYYFSE